MLSVVAILGDFRITGQLILPPTQMHLKSAVGLSTAATAWRTAPNNWWLAVPNHFELGTLHQIALVLPLTPIRQLQFADRAFTLALLQLALTTAPRRR